MASRKNSDEKVGVEYRGAAGVFNVDGISMRRGERRNVTREQFDRVRLHQGEGTLVELDGPVDDDEDKPAEQPGLAAIEQNPGLPTPGGEARSADPFSPVA